MPVVLDILWLEQSCRVASSYSRSHAGKNPAAPGTLLFAIFEWQAWISAAIGGVFACGLVFPSDKVTAYQALGMMSTWMFTVPSLRARDIPKIEKRILDFSFLLMPLLNIGVCFVYKNTGALWAANTFGLLFAYYYLGVYKLPFGQQEAASEAKAPPAKAEAAKEPEPEA